jgi:hypothetical protein
MAGSVWSVLVPMTRKRAQTRSRNPGVACFATLNSQFLRLSRRECSPTYLWRCRNYEKKIGDIGARKYAQTSSFIYLTVYSDKVNFPAVCQRERLRACTNRCARSTGRLCVQIGQTSTANLTTKALNVTPSQNPYKPKKRILRKLAYVPLFCAAHRS